MLNRRRRTVFFFLGTGLFFLALALDPSYLGNKLVSSLPGLADFRGFDQFMTIVYFCLAVLAALGVQVLLGRPGRVAKATPRILLVAILLALAFEFWSAPYPLYKTRVPEPFREIARDPSRAALLDLPLQTNLPWVGPDRNMFYQTIHGKPRFAATLSRIPKGLYAPYSGYKNLVRLRQGAIFNIGDLNRELDRLKVGYVVVERAYYPTWRRLEALASRKLGWELMGRAREYTFYRRPTVVRPSPTRPSARASSSGQ